MSFAPRHPGIAYLVGAGPGDPGLITLRGMECLQRADLVLYDFLVNSEVLSHTPATSERICLGRHGHGRLISQDEINARMIDACRRGQTVVRLKGGDPAVFAHAAEEISALSAAGVPFEIVPGITSALAVGSYAGVPLTHRDRASAVALVTGQQKETGDDATEAPLDYRALSHFPGTLVFYMGVTTARHWTSELIAGGKSAATPTAIVRRCSWPDQRTHCCTLGEVPDLLERQKIRPPALIIVGDVVGASALESWFTSRPLFGQCVLVTRPLDQTQSTRQILQELGAEVLVQPAIEIGEPADWAPVDRALTSLATFDWLVFSSANGVRGLLNRLRQTGRDLRALGSLRLAVIGPGTAEELARYHLVPDLQPAEFRAESLAAALAPTAAGKRYLLARASRGREVLADTLRIAGAGVEQIVVYESRDVTRPNPEIAAAMAAGRIDWATVTSSAIARSMVSLFGEALSKTRLVSISPITSETLRLLGSPPAAEATEYTMAGVIAAIQTDTNPKR